MNENEISKIVLDAPFEIHKEPGLTHLKHTKLKLGILINFNVVLLKDGIKRIANNL